MCPPAGNETVLETEQRKETGGTALFAPAIGGETKGPKLEIVPSDAHKFRSYVM
jgi:hypothetical protein